LLRERLKILFQSAPEKRAELFKDSPTGKKYGYPIAEIDSVNSISIMPYGFRSFDIQYVVADDRFLDRAAPSLWVTHNEKQVYFSSLFNHPLGNGPALTVSANVPDLHHF